MVSLGKFLKTPFLWLGGNAPRVVVVELSGPIGVDARPGRGLSAVSVDPSLVRAFSWTGVKAVVLAINSPGGAPAQARMIMERARGLSREKQVDCISYIEDVGASGGYLIALAGDEIIADPFAIVGSIGVVSAGFGFPEAIAKLGIERRVHAAGDNKVRLDPFQPEKEEDRVKLAGILEATHGLFIDIVRRRRGGRITGPDDRVFNGDFFLAGEALELGLIDGVGDLRQVLKDRFGTDVKIRRITARPQGLLGRLAFTSSAALVDAVWLKLKAEVMRGRAGLS